MHHHIQYYPICSAKFELDSYASKESFEELRMVKVFHE